MSWLTIEEAQQLIANNLTGTQKYSDPEIQSKIDAAEAQIEDEIGPLAPRAVTVSTRVSSRGTAVLPVGPYVGPITALRVDNTASTDWSAVWVDGNGIAHGLPPLTSCVLTYTAGWADLPANYAEAVREQFKHVWGFRRGNTRAPDAERGSAHAMPYRVTELLNRVGGFA